MIILLQANWFFSQNPGSDCESNVVAVFNNKTEYDTYLVNNHITPDQFDHHLNLGEEVKSCDDLCWYHKQTI